MNRSYRPGILEQERSHLQALLAAETANGYRDAMQRLGEDLGRLVSADAPASGTCMVVCTVEDADFLARGFLDALGAALGPERIALHCFWNERRRVGGTEIAPIVRRYSEPGDNITALVVIKSIISGACVVRTNLMEVLERTAPPQIFVVAPVIHADAEQKLEREFPPEITERFSHVWLARDQAREADGTIRPGVGGSVYTLLGLGGETEKNRYYPRLIHERRALRHPELAS